MKSPDNNPTGGEQHLWTRWDSAKVAANSIAEVAISLDANSTVDVMLWDSLRGRFQNSLTSINRSSEINTLFDNNHPERGSTPLYEALLEIYNKKLKDLLTRSEPFTVIILTDGSPDYPNKVKSFFKTIIKDHRLEEKGRETLAAFSFVRMGDDPGAINFLQDLDDNLIQELDIKIDIVDTKEDNYLFGTGRYQGVEGVGPFGLFWSALYD